MLGVIDDHPWGTVPYDAPLFEALSDRDFYAVPRPWRHDGEPIMAAMVAIMGCVLWPRQAVWKRQNAVSSRAKVWEVGGSHATPPCRCGEPRAARCTGSLRSRSLCNDTERDHAASLDTLRHTLCSHTPVPADEPCGMWHHTRLPGSHRAAYSLPKNCTRLPGSHRAAYSLPKNCPADDAQPADTLARRPTV
jgi:hypothetical protein